MKIAIGTTIKEINLKIVFKEFSNSDFGLTITFAFFCNCWTYESSPTFLTIIVALPEVT